MRVKQLYIVAMNSDPEASLVTVGLYRKYSPYADDAIALCYDRHKYYRVENLKKGNPKDPSVRQTGDLHHGNLQAATKAIKEIESPPQKPMDKRANVGIYVVMHGSRANDANEDGAKIAGRLEALIKLGAKPDVLCLLRCSAAPAETETASMHNRMLGAESSKEKLLVENLLIELRKIDDCRPVLTAWSTLVTASPGPLEPAQLGQHPELAGMPVGAKAIAVIPAGGGTATYRRPTPEERKKYKFGFYVDEKGEIKVLTRSEIHTRFYG